MLTCSSHRQTTAANGGVRDEIRLALPHLLNSHFTASFERIPTEADSERKSQSHQGISQEGVKLTNLALRADITPCTPFQADDIILNTPSFANRRWCGNAGGSALAAPPSAMVSAAAASSSSSSPMKDSFDLAATLAFFLCRSSFSCPTRKSHLWISFLAVITQYW